MERDHSEYRSWPFLLDFNDVAQIVAKKLISLAILPALRQNGTVVNPEEIEIENIRISVQNFVNDTEESKNFLVTATYIGDVTKSYIFSPQELAEFYIDRITLQFIIDDKDHVVYTAPPIGENSVKVKVRTLKYGVEQVRAEKNMSDLYRSTEKNIEDRVLGIITRFLIDNNRRRVY